MLFSYNWLQSFFNKKLPDPKRLSELLTLHSFEVQGINQVNKDWIFDVDITPNRPDCFSHYGLALECSAILNIPIKKLELIKNISRASDKKESLKVKLEDSNDCLRYSALIISDIKVGDSPKEIREKIISIGMDSINNIVDIVNYVMIEIGQPLHAFDLDKIAGNKIFVRRANNQEEIYGLDGNQYTLDKNILVIADTKGPIAIAGIKGGDRTKITENTKNILIEAANFNPVLIRKASKNLGLRTDASIRFEHGLDPNITELALKRAAYLIKKVSGGVISKNLIDLFPKRLSSRKIIIRFEKINKLLGIDISKKEVKPILKRLHIKVLKEDEDSLTVEVPTSRLDLKIEQDIVEEIGRIYGYYKIKPIPPISEVVFPQINKQLEAERKIKTILKSLGFVEVYNYSFLGERDAEWGDALIELENPVSKEFKYLRHTLLVNLIKAARENLKYFEDFKLFEIGKIFYLENKAPKEKKMLSGVIVEESKNGFYLLKGYIDSLFEELGISDYFFDDYKPQLQKRIEKIWHLNKTAEIKISGERIGYLGELSLRITNFYGLPKNVLAFELDVEKLENLVVEEREYKEIPRYPAVIRDIAILVPIRTKVDEVQKVIFQNGGKFLEDVDLFDIYFGDELPSGKKNLAFHLIFQAPDRTLRSEEVDNFVNKIIQSLEENPDWEVRKQE